MNVISRLWLRGPFRVLHREMAPDARFIHILIRPEFAEGVALVSVVRAHLSLWRFCFVNVRSWMRGS